MLILIYICVFMGIGLILLGILKPAADISLESRLTNNHEYAKNMNLRMLLSKIFPWTQKILEKLKLEAKLKNKIDAAHVRLSAQEFFNLKILIILLFSGVAIFLFQKADPLIIIGAICAGYFLPDFWLSRKIAGRKYKIARILPETVDLLSLCVEAGLDFTMAVKWVTDKIPNNPMIEELSFVLEEIKWGKSRLQALKDMSIRLNIPEVRSFVQILVQADRMGTPVAEAFTILSEDMRLQRFHRGERIAMQAPIKILIPLVFCILPVIGIIIGGPIILQFMQGGVLKGF